MASAIIDLGEAARDPEENDKEAKKEEEHNDERKEKKKSDREAEFGRLLAEGAPTEELEEFLREHQVIFTQFIPMRNT